MDAPDLDTVADEIYGLSPSEFTAARDASAAEARRTGDKALAAAVKKLRRPSVGAWLANLLSRQRRQEVDRLLSLGAELRQAQEQLAGDQLRALSQQRQRVVAALVQEARGLAGQGGQTVSTAAARELQETLEAALADPVSAEALRSGRLTGPLVHTGLGVPEVPESEAAPDPGAGGKAAAREAETALAAARRRAEHQEEELRRAADEHRRVRERIEDLTRQVEELRAREPTAADRVDELRETLERTRAEVRTAERRVGDLAVNP